jgi:hypothetical protein
VDGHAHTSHHQALVQRPVSVFVTGPSKSTCRSTALSGRSSPLAIDPNTGRLFTPWSCRRVSAMRSALPFQPFDFGMEGRRQFGEQRLDVAHLMLHRQNGYALWHTVVEHEVLPRRDHQEGT